MEQASLDELRAEVARLATALEAVGGERERYHALYLDALEKIRKLELGLLGQKAERLPANDAQLSMALLAELIGREPTPEPPAKPPTQTVREHERPRPGRYVAPGEELSPSASRWR